LFFLPFHFFQSSFHRIRYVGVFLLQVNHATPDGNKIGTSAAASTDPLSAIKQLLLWCIGQSPHTLPAIMLALVEGLPGVAPADVTKLYDETARMRDEFATLMGDRGVMLFPPFTRTAPRHGMPLLTPIDFSYTAIWNALELPVTQVPLGLDGQGLPLGVQVVGQPCTDHLTMSVALALEADLGGWVPPWTARAGS
jgi:fatty acid amide hydrolase 2